MDTFQQATYSPEDNKLRLYVSSRLNSEEYARVKAMGFKWAPKQDLFVAPMWTPQREDFLLSLVEEIEDEDTSLVDRAEDRAERFDGYQENRTKDAQHAQVAADSISERFAGGQPILVGHHSERRARKDQEKMDNHLRKTIKLWETASYWKSRAAGALRHAKYKELPAVRARRIKGIQADKRKQERHKKEAEMWLKLWSVDGLTLEQGIAIADRCWLHMPRKEGDKPDFNQNPTASSVLTNDYPSLYAPRTLEEVVEVAKAKYPKHIVWCERWIAHLENRLTYETAMLDEQGGSDLIKPKPRPTQRPLLNYRQERFVISCRWTKGRSDDLRQVEMTKAEYKAIYEDRRGTREYEGHRVRSALIRIPHTHDKGLGEHGLEHVLVFLTDSKTHPKPEPIKPELIELRPLEAQGDYESPMHPIRPTWRPCPLSSEEEKIQEMKAVLKAPKNFVAAPMLYPTPAWLAEKVVELADIQPGHHVLEPSAGIGNLLKAIPCVRPAGSVTAVEIAWSMGTYLEPYADRVLSEDFLGCNGNLGTFDRIVMNPPFNQGADIQHIRHAQTFLKPGGKLVAICANGPRQQDTLKPLASYWEDLPEDTFKDAGTQVRTALLVIEA